MRFLWHEALWLLLAVPVLVYGYVLTLHRKALRGTLRYTNIDLLRAAAEGSARVRRYVPPLLFLLGVIALLLGTARPSAIVAYPAREGSVVLAIDVSISMAADDIAPTRLAAAQAAAASFVRSMPPGVRIAVVAFAAHAELVQPLTLDRTEVLRALERLRFREYTGIGEALMAALRAIHPEASLEGPATTAAGAGTGSPAGWPGKVRAAWDAALSSRPATDLSSAIVLLSDGVGTFGVGPLQAARAASAYGLRVYALGLGTPYGGVARVEGWPMIHAEFDEDVLRKIADETRGRYFYVNSAEKLNAIFDELSRRTVLEPRALEITVVLAALGASLLIAAGALSCAWHHRFG